MSAGSHFGISRDSFFIGTNPDIHLTNEGFRSTNIFGTGNLHPLEFGTPNLFGLEQTQVLGPISPLFDLTDPEWGIRVGFFCNEGLEADDSCWD
jgi:hypothetical protein